MNGVQALLRLVGLAAVVISMSACGGGGGGGGGGDSSPCGSAAQCKQATTLVMASTVAGLTLEITTNGSSITQPSFGICSNVGLGGANLFGSRTGTGDPYAYTLAMGFFTCAFTQGADSIEVSGDVAITGVATSGTAIGSYDLSTDELEGSGTIGGTSFTFSCAMTMELAILGGGNFSYEATICGQDISYP